MCATCHAFIPFCSMHLEILTIRAPLNGDQLCGHVYVAWPNYSNHSQEEWPVSAPVYSLPFSCGLAMVTITAPLNGDKLCGHVYLAWPNYCNHCCRQQIKVSWDLKHLSKQFQKRILTVLGLFFLVFLDLIMDIVIASWNPSVWMDQTGLSGA